jgi:hypothetical protein
MEELPCFVVLLTPANEELAFLDRDVQLIAGETGDRQRDTQAFRVPVLTGNPLDVVGRIAVCTFGHAIERTLDLIEAKQKGT